jgi:hypothetical protein
MIGTNLWPRDYLKDHGDWNSTFAADDSGNPQFSCFLPSGRTCNQHLPQGWKQVTGASQPGLYINGPGFARISNLQGGAFYQFGHRLVFYLLQGNIFSWAILSDSMGSRGCLFTLVREAADSHGKFNLYLYQTVCKEDVLTCKYNAGQSKSDALVHTEVCGSRFEVAGASSHSFLEVYFVGCDGKTQIARPKCPLYPFHFGFIGLLGASDSSSRLAEIDVWREE